MLDITIPQCLFSLKYISPHYFAVWHETLQKCIICSLIMDITSCNRVWNILREKLICFEELLPLLKYYSTTSMHSLLLNIIVTSAREISIFHKLVILPKMSSTPISKLCIQNQQPSNIKPTTLACQHHNC